jgi:hypothetical protein
MVPAPIRGRAKGREQVLVPLRAQAQAKAVRAVRRHRSTRRRARHRLVPPKPRRGPRSQRHHGPRSQRHHGPRSQRHGSPSPRYPVPAPTTSTWCGPLRPVMSRVPARTTGSRLTRAILALARPAPCGRRLRLPASALDARRGATHAMARQGEARSAEY